MIQNNLWSIIGLILGVISSTFLLLGAIRRVRMATIMYLTFEIVHIIEMLVACIVIFVDLIAFGNYKCACGGPECENNDEDICGRIGIMLGSVLWVYVLLDIYFWMCAFSLLMKTHIGKSPDFAEVS